MIGNIILIAVLTGMSTGMITAQEARVLVYTDSLKARVSPELHGIFFEEISHGGEGGLYAEMIQNRGFEDFRIPPGCHLDSGWLIPPRTPHYSIQPEVSDWKMPWEVKSDYPAWSLQTAGKGQANLSLSEDQPLTPATPHSLKVEVKEVSGRVSVVNDGFWGIRVDEGESYRLSLYIRSEHSFQGPVVASLEANHQVLASQRISWKADGTWKKFECVLKAKGSASKAAFYLSFGSKGTCWIDFVSLFPVKTFLNRPNGMRLDLANYLKDLHPAFIRWPGGCFVEGVNIQSAPDWKKTIGRLEDRPGTYSPWGYWSSDGFGYHEYLQFCEDLGASALYVFNCGVSCDYRSGTFVPDDSIGPYVQNALDAIEYALGPINSRWGARRAANGHPQPFPLKYVEVGNEQVGSRYGERYNIFYKAIKEKYPQLEIIASMGIAHLHQPTLKAIQKLDIADEHTYKSVYWPMVYHDWYDKYPRHNDWQIYVGEYACNGGVGKGNMMAALNDAASVLMFERNSDLIRMASYAPLLENVNTTHWDVNLIKFNNAQSFGRISYYVIKMMNENKASVNLRSDTRTFENSPQKPVYGGYVGLSTWDTQARFKDIEIWQEGKKVYQSDFVNHPGEWSLQGGKWTSDDSTLSQHAEGAWPLAILKDKKFDTYTLKLKACKTGGFNAFMIPLAMHDSLNYLRVHIGAWWNRVAAFEMVTNGTDAMVSQPVNLEQPIEMNRWYDIEIRVSPVEITCYLDGKLLMSYHEPARFFCLAGKDERTGEIILKIVNACGKEMDTDFVLEGKDKIRSAGKVITLAAEGPDKENSMEEPLKYIPQETGYTSFGKNFRYTFKPYSVTILRIGKE